MWVLLNPPHEVISERIKLRTSHPGKVEGESGGQTLFESTSHTEFYDEVITSTSCAATKEILLICWQQHI
jgi:hypothetical protein